ncbi:MarR family winged helix-turn-helix transcriptional regulator [Jatrophihabitans sp.]|uniref:MarR family winged helix-turn-helix transcriptional regulator n=1 Tax=Jatrophihabitans sp. TaxID=1932789 RepID=UPI002CC8D9FC|nr:MarR family transcriptional regulator [Jatrophihabitans sp.]
MPPASRSRADGRAAPADVPDLVTAVLTASRVLLSVAVRSLAEVEDTVTIPQFRTLVVLDAHGQMNLNRLSGLLGVTPSTALRMIDRLLAVDLVSRRDNPVNRREVLLELTEAGRLIVEQVTAKRRAEIARIVTGMPAGQRTELTVALRAFAEAAGEPEPRSEASTSLGW